MTEKNQVVSFYALAGPLGAAEAEKRLRHLGFDNIQHSRDGKRLHIVAPRDLVERIFVLGESDPAARVPEPLRDAVAEVIFPATPDYYRPAR